MARGCGRAPSVVSLVTARRTPERCLLRSSSAVLGGGVAPLIIRRDRVGPIISETPPSKIDRVGPWSSRIYRCGFLHVRLSSLFKKSNLIYEKRIRTIASASLVPSHLQRAKRLDHGQEQRNSYEPLTGPANDKTYWGELHTHTITNTHTYIYIC